MTLRNPAVNAARVACPLPIKYRKGALPLERVSAEEA